MAGTYPQDGQVLASIFTEMSTISEAETRMTSWNREENSQDEIKEAGKAWQDRDGWKKFVRA